MKLAVERTILDEGGVVIRPGLVYGDFPGGMAGTLRTISRLPLWPRFGSARLYLAHDEDIAPAMRKVLEGYRDLSGQILGFANPRPLDLSSILTGLSATNERRHDIPVPAKLVMTALRLLEQAGVPLPFRSDSLLGLVEPAELLPGQGLLLERGIEFRGLGA
jgi:NAD dependent epimerase/dehydratase family enzyme